MNPEELKYKLDAVLAILPTPFTDRDEVDVEGLRENIRFLIEKGSGRPLVIVPGGSGSEFFSLTEQEYKTMIKAVIDEAKGKLPIVAGVGAEGTKKALSMCKYVEDAGADGVMVTLPYYAAPTKEGMYQHFKKIAEGIDIGIIVYNSSTSSKVYISPELMARIADIPGIIGSKECAKKIVTHYWQQKLAGDKIKVMSGLGELNFFFESHVGSKGYISWPVNFAPEICLDLLDAVNRKDFIKSQEIIDKMYPLFYFEHTLTSDTTAVDRITSHRWIVSQKVAMDLMGLHGGPGRLPLMPLSPLEKEKLRESLIKMNLLIK